ncbi:hypothetical protein SprV_0200748300 [Sparganum proliferum]
MLALGAERRKRWRLRHEEFLHIVLSARAAKRAEQGGEPVFIEPLPAEVTQAGLVLCEKCGRRFSEGVFKKHKDLCKELRDAQATDLTEEQKDAKARFLQRMKYSHRVCGRATQQDSTDGKEASTPESRTENHPTLSCAAEMQKIQFLLNDIIPTLSNVPDKLQSSSAVNVFLQQLLPAGLPPSLDESLLQVSNCNKTIMPNCELPYPPESDSRSVSQLFCAGNNLRDSNVSDNLTKYSSPSAVSSVSSLSTLSPPLDSSHECSQKGPVEEAEEEVKQKVEGTYRRSRCLSGAASSPSTIEPKFLTDCLSSKTASACCLRKCRATTTDNSKVTTPAVITNAALPASDGDSYVTTPNLRSNVDKHAHLTPSKAKHQHNRPHEQPEISNYVKNNCKSSSGVDTGPFRSLPTCCESRNGIHVSAVGSDAKNTAACERRHHCHRHHQHRHHQRHGPTAVSLVGGHQLQKSRQSESHCETVPGLVARQDSATFPSAEKNCMRPNERCPLPPVEICFEEAQLAQRSSLSRPNTTSSPVFYQFVKTTEAGDRGSSVRCQGGLEKPVLPPSPCDPISVTSVSFMSAGTDKTNNSQYLSAEATDQLKQSAAASPASSSSLVYLDVESPLSNDVSASAGNVLKPSTYSSNTYKPSNLTSYALGSVTSTILTQTLRSDAGTSKSSRDGRPFALNEQAHLTEKRKEPHEGGPPTKTTTMLQNISISDSTESLAHCKFCSQCGERFFDDAKFCVLCGTSRRFGRQHSLVVTAVRPKVNPASG